VGFCVKEWTQGKTKKPAKPPLERLGDRLNRFPGLFVRDWKWGEVLGEMTDDHFRLRKNE
jgi:hypothetical protein